MAVSAAMGYWVINGVGLAYMEPIVYERPAKQYPIVQAVVTAYTSSEDETDSSPFETASGAKTERGVVACPIKYKFGTKIEIDGRQYWCEDRMNRRYWHEERFDVWVVAKKEAYNWGRRELAIKILSDGAEL